ncbi:MAG TPA: zf-HC2 domain-containing protein [Bryobacteraceae bacterium]|nr:zf-HC2 domain-containing protein [Bryobacteraceae bacterium]
MSKTPVSGPDCRQAMERMDGYIDESLSPEHARELSEHLDHCSPCSQEFETRKGIRGRLRSAAQAVPTPAYLEARVRSRIRGSRSSSQWTNRLMAAAVMAVLAIGVGVSLAYRSGYLRLTADSKESYIASASSQVPSLMRVGLGDHIHCAVFRKYPKNPPPVEEFARQLGPEFSGLIPVVQQQVPSDYRLILAHQCRYHNRRFVHLTLTNGSRLLSLVIARKGEGESFQKHDLLPALSEAGLSIYRAGVQRFQMAAFETRDHLVYVISDLPQERNTELMRAMAPVLSGYLSKLES